MSTQLCKRLSGVNLGKEYSYERLLRFLQTGGKMLCLEHRCYIYLTNFDVGSVYVLSSVGLHNRIVLSNGQHERDRYFGRANGWEINRDILFHKVGYKFKLFR